MPAVPGKAGVRSRQEERHLLRDLRQAWGTLPTGSRGSKKTSSEHITGNPGEGEAAGVGKLRTVSLPMETEKTKGSTCNPGHLLFT